MYMSWSDVHVLVWCTCPGLMYMSWSDVHVLVWCTCKLIPPPLIYNYTHNIFHTSWQSIKSSGNAFSSFCSRLRSPLAGFIWNRILKNQLTLMVIYTHTSGSCSGGGFSEPSSPSSGSLMSTEIWEWNPDFPSLVGSLISASTELTYWRLNENYLLK